MKKYLVNIHEFYDIEVNAGDKEEAKEKAMAEYENNPSRWFNDSDVAGIEEIEER